MVLPQTLYVDDGAFIFNSREDPIKGISIVNAQFKKIGMAMHIRKNGKASKTECIFPPPSGYSKQPLL